jgi:hypothetical protein
MIWRNPVDRAISLYKDIVCREEENKRVVQHPESIALHEYIHKNSPNFDSFVKLLINEKKHPSPYLLKPQKWWLSRFRPNFIYQIKDLNRLINSLTGIEPEKQHVTSDIESEITVTPRQKAILMEVWDSPKPNKFL